jgi:hypothetical protein
VCERLGVCWGGGWRLEYWIVGFGSVLSLLPFLLSYIDLLSDCVGDGLNLNLIRLGEGSDLALIRLAEGCNLMSMRLLLFLYCPPCVWLDLASVLFHCLHKQLHQFSQYLNLRTCRCAAFVDD